MVGNAIVSLTTVRRHGLGLVAKNYASVLEKYIWPGSTFFPILFTYLHWIIHSTQHTIWIANLGQLNIKCHSLQVSHIIEQKRYDPCYTKQISWKWVLWHVGFWIRDLLYISSIVQWPWGIHYSFISIFLLRSAGQWWPVWLIYGTHLISEPVDLDPSNRPHVLV